MSDPRLLTAAPLSIREHIAGTVALALPVMIARAGGLVIITVDTVMTGWSGAEELAFLALGAAPQAVVMMIGLGTLIGTSVLVSQADGAGRPEECGRIWRSAVQLAFVFGLGATVLCHFGEEFFLLIGQAPDLAAGGGRVLRAAAWQMPPMLVGIATTFFLESIKKPLPGMIAMLVANVANVGLNWVMIYGHLGFSAMGAEGAVFATTVARWLVAAIVVGTALLMADGARYGTRGSFLQPWAEGRTLRRLGYPFGIAQGIETASFTAMIFLAGWLGAVQLAGYQIVMNMVIVVFMAAVGIATATGVRVGNAVGRGDATDRARAAYVGIALVALVMGGFAVLVGVAGAEIAGLYTDDRPVVAAAAAVLAVAAWLMVFDGVQTVLIAAVRGAGDAWIPTAMQGLAFWGVMTPLGYWLAFHQDHGAPGLMAGAVVGVTVASALLGWRMVVVLRRPVRMV